MLAIVVTLGLLTQAPTLTPRDSAYHVLNRLAYGARPGEADSVARFGVMKWIERQLDPDHISDERLAAREREFKLLSYDRGDLAARYRDAQQQRRKMQRAASPPDPLSDRRGGSGPMREFRELILPAGKTESGE